MNWVYHIPHAWEQPTTTWEDVWLLPDDPAYTGESIWLTVNALGDFLDGNQLPFDNDEPRTLREFRMKMGEGEYVIDDGEIYLRARHFDKEGLLHWVRIWLREKGLEAEQLSEAPFERFARTNPQAASLAMLRERFSAEGLPEA